MPREVASGDACCSTSGPAACGLWFHAGEDLRASSLLCSVSSRSLTAVASIRNLGTADDLFFRDYGPCKSGQQQLLRVSPLLKLGRSSLGMLLRGAAHSQLLPGSVSCTGAGGCRCPARYDPPAWGQSVPAWSSCPACHPSGRYPVRHPG